MRAILALMLLLLPLSARALESAPVTSARATATLVSETDAVAPGQAFRVGLRLRMAPGWHSYWSNPGDAGVAPELDFTLPPGVAAGPVAWPAPQRDAEGPLMTYGYTGEVLLPVRLTGAAGATAVKLHATWLVCSNICVPETGDFTLDLPAGNAASSAQASLFAAADARMPRPSPWAAQVSPEGVLRVSGGGRAVREAWFIPGEDGEINNAAPQSFRPGEDGFALVLKPGAGFRPGDGLTGVLVVRDAAGQETALQINAAPGPAETRLPWPEALGFALLGGLLLNLMPCVFPVLAMKAIGLAGLAGRERLQAWEHAAAYALGVVLSFLALGGLLLAARAAGSAAGWGFQFQSPVFVGAMACLLFAVGLNLSGVFAVGGGGIGAGLAGRRGLAGSFFTGLLAVLLASPCTAPFMGAAIAAALASSVGMVLVVFLGLGLGLAAPYVALAVVPGLARALPRPGRWMLVLKQVLAFPMYAASAWLVWVLSQQAGPPGVLGIAAGLVLIGFAAWLLGLAQSGVGPRLGRGAAVLAGLAAVLVLGSLAPAASTQARTHGEAFSAARLSALRQAGRPVFVNMTAAWCVTCLVNERVALDSAAVRQAFAAHDVAVLTGDWTLGDAEISRFLRSQGRDGVPLYLLYPAKGGAPVVLPQILTEGTVVRAVEGLPK